MKKHEEMSNEISLVVKEIQDLQSGNIKLEKKLSDRRVVVDEFESKVEAQEQEIQQLRKEIREIKDETVVLTKEIERVQSELEKENYRL